MKTTKIAAEVSLYGTSAAGHGYIVRLADGRMLGDGSLEKGRSATETIWMALDAARENGLSCKRHEMVAVHYDFPQGPLMALIPCIGAWPYFGDLKWTDGPVYEMSAEAIQQAAKEAK